MKLFIAEWKNMCYNVFIFVDAAAKEGKHEIQQNIAFVSYVVFDDIPLWVRERTGDDRGTK